MKLKIFFCLLFSVSSVFGQYERGRYNQRISSSSADYIIAASNSDSAWKARAAYVCDGTADQVQIQAAIDKLKATGLGGEIFLAPGTYNLSATIEFKAAHNIILSGTWGSVLKPIAQGATQLGVDAITVGSYTNSSGLTQYTESPGYGGNTDYCLGLILRGFKIDGSNQTAVALEGDCAENYTTGTATFTNGSTTITGSGTTWSASGNSGAVVGRQIKCNADGTYYTIATRVGNGEITIGAAYAGATAAGAAYTIYPGRTGIKVICSGCTIDGVYVYNTGGDGIIAFQPTDAVEVRNCVVDTCRGGWGAIHSHGLNWNFYIIDNTVVDCATVGLRHGSIISGNAVINCARYPLFTNLTSAVNNNNYMVGCPYGILIHGPNQQITGNVLRGNGTDQPACYTESTYGYNTITNNEFYGYVRGILLSGSGDVVSGNVISCAAGSAYGYGLRLYSTYYTVVTGNTITNYGGHNSYENAVKFEGTTTDFVFSGNTIDSQDGTSSNQPNYGIYIDTTVVRGKVSDNVILGVNTDEIYIGNTTTELSGNKGATAIPERKFLTLKNTSGGQLTAGTVVVGYDPDGAYDGSQFTTTTTAGDGRVIGMVAETINDNAVGLVLVFGKTTVLKANGEDGKGGDIAIGDYLSAGADAGTARKAASGQVAFAVAAEAYAGEDSAGVIDAYLITPRQMP